MRLNCEESADDVDFALHLRRKMCCFFVVFRFTFIFHLQHIFICKSEFMCDSFIVSATFPIIFMATKTDQDLLPMMIHTYLLLLFRYDCLLALRAFFSVLLHFADEFRFRHHQGNNNTSHNIYK